MSLLRRMRVLAETELAGARIVLEPLQPWHAVELLAGLQSPGLYAFIPQEPPPDLTWLDARYGRLATRGPADQDSVWLNWAMRLGDGRYCGAFEATAMADGTVDIAYFVFVAHQQHGFAREAATTVIEAFWADPDVRLIGATIDTRNLASAALLERLGFERVRTVADADFFKGATSHEYRYELARQVGPK